MDIEYATYLLLRKHADCPVDAEDRIGFIETHDVLAVRRNDNPKSKWHLPGGNIDEDDEDKDQAEMILKFSQEQTNLTFNNINKIYENVITDEDGDMTEITTYVANWGGTMESNGICGKCNKCKECEDLKRCKSHIKCHECEKHKQHEKLKTCEQCDRFSRCTKCRQCKQCRAGKFKQCKQCADYKKYEKTSEYVVKWVKPSTVLHGEHEEYLRELFKRMKLVIDASERQGDEQLRKSFRTTSAAKTNK
jgi:ADP-ribose pyrophosphatase YjhB (NUDIX family)